MKAENINNNEVTVSLSKAELEILLRGAMRMSRHYKNRFANAESREEEDKSYGRYLDAESLHTDIEMTLGSMNALHSVFNIMLVSAGGVKHLFEGDFNSEEEAVARAEELEWEYKDENDFVWNLVVEEE